MRQAEEPVDEILKRAAKRRFELRPSQLHRYQQAGLIPSPRQVGLGRGRGTKTMYPAGTSEQLVAACVALRLKNSLKFARWHLWWNCHAIDLDHIRKDLS